MSTYSIHLDLLRACWLGQWNVTIVHWKLYLGNALQIILADKKIFEDDLMLLVMTVKWDETVLGQCLSTELAHQMSVLASHVSDCKYFSEGGRCLAEQRQARKTSSESGIPIFMPECTDDGNYKQVQCHQGESLFSAERAEVGF